MLSHEEIKDRVNFIGSSDLPVLLGYVPQKSIVDLWLEKTGQAEPDFESSPAAMDGQILERPLAEIWARDNKLELTYGMKFIHPEYKFLRAQADGYVLWNHEHLEVKVSGLRNPRLDLSGWGEPMTDQIPKSYLLQAQFCMMCMQSKRAHVFAFLRTRGLVSYVVHRNEKLHAGILKACIDFWHCVQDKRRPDVPDVAHRETLARVQREPEKIVPIDSLYVDTYHDLRGIKKEAERNFDDYKSNIIEMLGDAEVGAAPNGSFHYTKNKKGSRVLTLKGYIG